jgi:hypothetical protein
MASLKLILYLSGYENVTQYLFFFTSLILTITSNSLSSSTSKAFSFAVVLRNEVKLTMGPLTVPPVVDSQNLPFNRNPLIQEVHLFRSPSHLAHPPTLHYLHSPPILAYPSIQFSHFPSLSRYPPTHPLHLLLSSEQSKHLLTMHVSHLLEVPNPNPPAHLPHVIPFTGSFSYPVIHLSHKALLDSQS